MAQKKLIDSALSGDEAALAALLKQSEPLLRYIISPILADPREREECLADVTVRVWEKLHSFDPEKGSFKAWLTAICRNAALNRVRQNRDEASLSQLDENLPSPAHGPEEQLLMRERQEALLKALNCLNKRDRLIFYRKYYYLQPTAQIAAELGTTERSVEGRLYRTKNKLKKLLGGEWNE